jgi:hypothetical protein
LYKLFNFIYIQNKISIIILKRPSYCWARVGAGAEMRVESWVGAEMRAVGVERAFKAGIRMDRSVPDSWRHVGDVFTSLGSVYTYKNKCFFFA